MTSKIKFGEVEEFDDSDKIIKEIEGLEIAIFNFDDSFHAVANYCVHQGGPLCEGGIMTKVTISEEDNWTWEHDEDTKCITCPWHGWRYDVSTGVNTEDGRYSVPTFETEVINDEIFVSI